MTFRKVNLPDTIPGILYLSSMPGRFESMENFKCRMAKYGIRRIICLNPAEEIQEASPRYYHLIVRKDHPWKIEHFPVPDFGVPEDREGFFYLAKDMATCLRSGERMLVHCYAGVGRTGTFSMIMLMALGLSRSQGATLIRQAGAKPEGLYQQDLIDWCAGQLSM